ncbi:MAG: putative RNase H-like nuclease [Psychroserpens sp.]
MITHIIGIDCATDPKKVGLARAIIDGDNLTVDRVAKPVTGQSVSGIVSEWINKDIKTLLAVDAPLGWPESLGNQLSLHTAGNLIDINSNCLFRRETDRFIKRKIGKQPLDVGADRIARTAHAGLKYLDEIGKATRQKIPLAWSNELTSTLSAIEVYPAATLKQSGIRSDGYKKKENTDQRTEIFSALSNNIQFSADTSILINDDDVLDAVVCVLAGSHFMKNLCMKPADSELAKKEGWIWVIR